MALSPANIYEIRSTATAGNVNGGGFNPENANMLTDLACDTNTGNTSSPVVSSASYNFVAGDVGAKLFVKSGTNWIAGWYPILSVASSKATLDGTIGNADIITNRVMGVNTTAGCSTVGTPTSGTFTIDYSQQDSAVLALSDLTSTASTTITTVTGGITPVMRGNVINLSSGTGVTTGWYEVVNTTNGTTFTSDRASGTYTLGVGKIGGAMSLGSGDNTFFNIGTASSTRSNLFFVKGNVTYSTSATITLQTGNAAYPQEIIGYYLRRNDKPTGSTRPVFSSGTTRAITQGGQSRVRYISLTGSINSDATIATSSNVVTIENCKVVNKSTTAGSFGISVGGLGDLILGCEVISYRGTAIDISSATREPCVVGCYIHHSNIGINGASSSTITDNVIEECVTSLIVVDGSTVASKIVNNTLYGAENKLGNGINSSSNGANIIALNNIFYGLTTGMNFAAATNNFVDRFNDFYNNTTDSSQTPVDPSNLTLSPVFSNVTQLTGTTATTSGSVLTQSGADFSSVVDGRDYCYIKSGSGVTAGIYGITSHTTTTLTLDIAPGTNATANKVWQVTLGHNFAIGTNLKSAGFPGAFPAALTTGYLDIGGVQRAEAGGGGGGGQSFISG